MGGGVHLDLFHELDYTHWLFGKPVKTFSLKRNVSSLSINAVDYANYVLEYKTFTANIVLNYYRREPKRTIEILFEDDALMIDLINCKIADRHSCIIYENVDFNIIDI
jgi:predicted dehydrogenase